MIYYASKSIKTESAVISPIVSEPILVLYKPALLNSLLLLCLIVLQVRFANHTKGHSYIIINFNHSVDYA